MYTLSNTVCFLTGCPDNATYAAMERPRCGCPDQEPRGARTKRYVLGGKRMAEIHDIWFQKSIIISYSVFIIGAHTNVLQCFEEILNSTEAYHISYIYLYPFLISSYSENVYRIE